MKNEKEEQAVIILFDTLKKLILEKSSQDNGYSKVVELLSCAIERVTNRSQTHSLRHEQYFKTFAQYVLLIK